VEEEAGATPGQAVRTSTEAKSQGSGGGGGGGGGGVEEGVMTDPEDEIDEEAMNYDFAMKEVILNELDSGMCY